METYEEIVSKIENMRRFGKKSGYDISKELLSYLGYPEHSFQTVHIAGTNGKGSTAMFISSILSTKRKVGLFTSPHLISFSERIQIGEKNRFCMIAKEDVVRLGKQVLAVCEEHRLEPTMFDITLAMAVLYFKEQGCDYAVLETGLGGTLDSTRAVSTVPAVSVITNIGFDHEAILGNTLSEIAKNKAGILRKGTKAVIGSMDETAKQVIVDACMELAVSYVLAEEEDSFNGKSVKDIPLGLLGEYQLQNAKNAIAAVKLLNENFDVEKGLAEAKWPGRMDIVSTNPIILLDGAHNPQGVEALRNSLEHLYPKEKFTFIVGVLADKDYAKMMQTIFDIGRRFYTVTVDSSRALQGKELAKTILSYGVKAADYDKIEEAISDAKKYSEKIVIFGSLYFVGEVLELFKER